MNPVAMEALTHNSAAGRQFGHRMPLAICGLLALVICCFSVSSRSFWLDEVGTVQKALQPTIPAWWHTMVLDLGSDKQMPGYMLFMWAWEKIVSHGEWVMRSAGIPWLIAGLWIFAGRRVERWIVVMSSAFTWYCLDEARPYALQLGASLALFGSMERLTAGSLRTSPGSERRWLILYLTGLFVLSSSSLLGMIWAGASVAAFLCLLPCGQQRALWLAYLRPALITGVLLVALTVYYLWTVRAGAGAARLGQTEWRNILFIAFELLGFIGLGPGRNELRAVGAGALTPYVLPLALGFFTTATVALSGVYRLRKTLSGKRSLLVILIVFGTMTFLLGAGVLKHFRVLGRHFTPVEPLVFWILAEGISELWQARNFFKRAAVAGFIVLAYASCLSFRLSPRHAKDDYRGAAGVARTALAAGKVVWWDADRPGGELYHVPLRPTTAPFERKTAVLVWYASEEELSELPRPDLVVVSKPDIFDMGGGMRKFLEQHQYELAGRMQAFTFWRRRETAQ